MRALVIGFLLSGCASALSNLSPEQVANSPAGRCVSTQDPAKQCCTAPAPIWAEASTATCDSLEAPRGWNPPPPAISTAR